MTTIQKMDKEDLQNALDALDEGDRETIMVLSKRLGLEIKDRGPHKIMFGYWSALELLAKLGIFMNGRKV